MADDLKGMKVAILATDGVERIELEQPRGALYGAGASSDLLSIHSGEIQARQSDLISAGTFPVDHLVTDVSVEDYDALLLPGGTVNPDGLRINPDAVGFVKAFVATGKPVAASATVRGRSSRPMSSAVTGSPPGRACGPTCASRAPRQSTRSSSSTASSRPAVPPRTCPPSARRSSRNSPKPAFRARRLAGCDDDHRIERSFGHGPGGRGRPAPPGGGAGDRDNGRRDGPQPDSCGAARRRMGSQAGSHGVADGGGCDRLRRPRQGRRAR